MKTKKELLFIYLILLNLYLTETKAQDLAEPVTTSTLTPGETAVSKKSRPRRPRFSAAELVSTTTPVPGKFRRPGTRISTAAELVSTTTPKYPDIKTVEEKEIDQKHVREYFSMANIPATKAERKLVQKEITAKPDVDIKTAPVLDPNLVATQSDLKKDIYLAKYLEPWRDLNLEETVEMNFENKEITELLKFLEDNLNIKFILDDAVGPKRAEGLKPIAGTKITFRSNTPLNLKQAWELGLTFLEMSGYSVTPTTIDRTYHVTASQGKFSANSDPLPTFIGTDKDLLPNSNIKIRYVYFVENAELDTATKVIETLRSASGAVIKFPDLRALIITDNSVNIKSVIKILEEIDKVSTPETLAIIRLRHADATEVRKLYESLIGADQKTAFPFSQRKSPTTHYFTKATRVFDDPRTNSLIILGTRENIKKFEDFVFTYIDKKSDLPYSPLHIYPLKYMNAKSIADILNEMIAGFNADAARKEAATFGSVRDGNKFFKPTVKITPELSGNRLIINADYEDYLHLRDLLEQLDVEQPQVALKVLILDVDLTNLTQFGVQSRNSVACCDGSGGTSSLLGPNVNYQFAGLNGIVTRDQTPQAGTTTPANVGGAERLLGNLINLAATPSQGVGLFGTGTTLVTLGKDIFGVWGLLRVLEQITRVSVVANPFLVTSHKYKAEITVGETRRVLTAIVQAQQTQPAFGNLDANLSVVITPQISYDDMVTLDIYVDISQFVTGGDLPTILKKQISTQALAANREVIALGGLIRDQVIEEEFKVPVLGDIPLLGWLFKDKRKTVTRSSLLILISPEIIKPHDTQIAQEFTEYKITDTKETLYSMDYPVEKRDPIHRWLFRDHQEKEVSQIDKFTSRQARYVAAAEKEKRVKQVFASLDKQNNKNKKANKSLLELVKQNNAQGEVRA